MIPQDLKFTKSHEWVRLGEDGLATIGLSEFAVDQLGDIVFLELPAVGYATAKESTFGTIESVKAAVEIYAPLAGEVAEANDEAADNFDLLAQDPYGKGWLIKIKPAQPADMDSLMSAEEYEKHLQNA